MRLANTALPHAVRTDTLPTSAAINHTTLWPTDNALIAATLMISANHETLPLFSPWPPKLSSGLSSLCAHTAASNAPLVGRYEAFRLIPSDLHRGCCRGSAPDLHCFSTLTIAAKVPLSAPALMIPLRQTIALGQVLAFSRCLPSSCEMALLVLPRHVWLRTYLLHDCALMSALLLARCLPQTYGFEYVDVLYCSRKHFSVSIHTGLHNVVPIRSPFAYSLHL